MGELVSSPHGSASDGRRELVASVFDLVSWDMEGIAATTDLATVDQAIDHLTKLATPASKVEPSGKVDGKRGGRTSRLIGALSLLGAKIAPTMSDEQSKVWVSALTYALSDLPFAFSQRGAEMAAHTPMKFLNEVETVIREHAELARRRHDTAVRRLRNLRREVEQAGAPKLPPPEAREMTQEAINATPAPLLKAGLKAGYITQEQYDEAVTSQKDEQ